MHAPEAAKEEVEYAALVSLDWADQEHAWALQPNGGGAVEQGTLQNTPEAVEEWAQMLARRFGGRLVAVAIEQRRGAVIAMLSKYAHLALYPIHPSTLANYRKSFYPSGAKSDPGDTLLQLELLLRHRDRLLVLKPDTVETRTLQFLVEQRRKRVNEKTAYSNALTSWLKQIFPQVLCWFNKPASPAVAKFLERWPTLEHLRQARQATVRKFLREHGRRNEERIEQQLAEVECAVEATHDQALLKAGVLAVRQLLGLIAQLHQAIAECDRQIHEVAEAHPDFAIIKSFPGAGAAMAPRLLAALGTQRDRFASANDLQCYSGIAPVKSSSGQQTWVHWRWACPKFIRQTFHEWAQHSMKKCTWAREYYQQQRDRKKSHHAALRALAFKWLRILYRCWKAHRTYDELSWLSAREQRRPVPTNAAKCSPNSRGLEIQWKKVAGFSKPEAASS